MEINNALTMNTNIELASSRGFSPVDEASSNCKRWLIVSQVPHILYAFHPLLKQCIYFFLTQVHHVD